jgi:uncharacterized membrane protein YeaQ/YmgE (transglycosylase-associated protein family)
MDTLFTLLVWAVIGLVIGALAKTLMPGADSTNIVTTSVLGIVGALVGGAIASAVGLGSLQGFTLSGLVIAVLGALLVLTLYRLLTRRTV